MLLSTFLTCSVILTTSVAITEPIDGDTYDGDWLTVRAIVENENELPDSVHYTLNGEPVIQIPRLNTDWPTYMQNYQNHGYSESPAPSDNTILWTAPVTGDYHEFPTPVVVDGIVYYPSDHGTDSLYALDSATGELIWKYRVGLTDDAVTVCNGRVYSGSDSLYCLNALTGELLWVNEVANSGGSTPIVIGNRVFCGSRLEYPEHVTYVSCLDATTGIPMWQDSLAGASFSCMAVWNNMLFMPTYLPNDYSALYALDQETGEVIWANTDAYGGYWDSSPVIVEGNIYISGEDGKTRAIDAMSGSTVWETDVTPGMHIAATPAYHDGRLFFADQVDSYHCLGAENGTAVWDVPGLQHGSSAIADGHIFYGNLNPDSSVIRALDIDTGEEVWNYRPGGEWIYGSPSVTDGVLYMAAMDWNLYAFGTGLKYTFLDDLFAQVGSNELIVTSYDGGAGIAADTISFTVTGTGINLEPSHIFNLSATPNPFASNASISFELTESGYTSMQIFDLTGRSITSLANQDMLRGEHSVQWNGCTEDGQFVSAGLYLCRIESGGVIETTGLCLLK